MDHDNIFIFLMGSCSHGVSPLMARKADIRQAGDVG